MGSRRVSEGDARQSTASLVERKVAVKAAKNTWLPIFVLLSSECYVFGRFIALVSFIFPIGTIALTYLIAVQQGTAPGCNPF